MCTQSVRGPGIVPVKTDSYPARRRGLFCHGIQNRDMNIALIAALAMLGLSLVMLGILESGRRLGARDIARDPVGARSAPAIFGLMGLLIAFEFSGASGRLDSRRQLVAEEANDISTAWLRLDLLPASAQSALREKFRHYVDLRLAFYRRLPDIPAARAELARATALQGEIWNQALAACKETPAPAFVLLLPALNQMLDIATTRTIAAQMHPPALIYAMLGMLVLAASLMVGYQMAPAKTRNWSHILAFVVVNVFAIYVLLDLEFPRVGLIHVGGFDQVLVDVQQSLKP
jgi:hypothetical protein